MDSLSDVAKSMIEEIVKTHGNMREGSRTIAFCVLKTHGVARNKTFDAIEQMADLLTKDTIGAGGDVKVWGMGSSAWAQGQSMY